MSLLRDVAFLAHLSQCKASAKQQVNSMIDAIYAKVLLDLELWLNEHESNHSVHALALNHNEPTVEQMQSMSTNTQQMHQNVNCPPSLSPSHLQSHSNYSIKSEIDSDCEENITDHNLPCESQFDQCTEASNDQLTNTQDHQNKLQNEVSLDNAPSMDANCQLNSSNHQPALMSIKQEINDPSMNDLLQPQQNNASIDSSSSTNEFSSNTEIQPQPQPQQHAHIKHNQFDDEECDCDECVDGGIEVKVEDEEGQMDEESSRPVKRSKMDTTQQPHNAIHIMQKDDCEHGDSGQNINDGHHQAMNEVHECNEVVNGLLDEDKRPNEEGDPMGREQSEAIETRAIIGHCSRDNSDESMVIQQEGKNSNNAIGEESNATECTTNPIQPNIAQPNRHLQCSHCLKSFDRNSNLQQHLRVHTGERPFQCDQCDKSFKNVCNLTKHLLIHQNIKRFRCHQCEKQFTIKHQLDSHLRTHSGERPFKCRHCDMSFTQINTRNRHEQAIHLHVKPYRCKQCGHTATQRAHVIKHIRVVHFGLPATIKQQRALNIIDHRDPKELVEKV